MDYIQAKIADAINFIGRKNSSNIYGTLAQYYRILFEYKLFLTFACVWDRKSDVISFEKRSKILQAMSKPILGKTLDFIFQMNFDKDDDPVFYLSRDYEELMRSYIKLRNENFGHGAVVPNVQEGYSKELCLELENYRKRLAVFDQELWGEDCEFRLREDQPELGQIIVFPTNGKPEYRDIPKNIAAEYLQDHLYYYSPKEGNFNVSPFLIAKNGGGINYDFYCFTKYNIQSGKFDYNLISEIIDDERYKISQTTLDFFTTYRKIDKHTICRANGVISNKFENNYDYFVDTEPFSGYVKQIWNFLSENRSNTCLTIKGNGGIGKTALVHYVCTKYLFDSAVFFPKFNYVIFCSAKDRELRLNTMRERAEIYETDSEKRVSSYRDILHVISRVLYLNIEPNSEENISKIEDAVLNETGVLLIVDDFETLDDVEKDKIVGLIDKMQISRHKVLITTRSQYLTGIHFDIERMNELQTISFMSQRFAKIFNQNSDNVHKFHAFVKKFGNEKIYELTKGLPLLAIQASTLMTLNDFSESIFSKQFGRATEEFLLGRLYTYFAVQTLKILFWIIAFFVRHEVYQIPLNSAQNFYRLMCNRQNIVDADFKKDLNELRKYNIVQIESDYIQVVNKISYGFFDKYSDEFFKTKMMDDFFDERIFQLSAKYGSEEGILKYVELPDSKIDENMIKIFVFENVLKYRNEYRLKILDAFFQRCFDVGDKEKILEIYSEGKKYFDANETYLKLFRKYRIALPETEVTLSKKSSTIPRKIIEPVQKSIFPQNDFQDLTKKLEEIRDNVDEVLLIKHHAYKEERFRELAEKLGILCNVKLKQALEKFSDEHLQDARDVGDIITEISRTSRLNYLENENCKRLFSLLSQKMLNSFNSENSEVDELEIR